jgi:tetratricopeptide (TPR) repeat protein
VTKRLDAFRTMIERGATDPFVHYAYAMELRGMGRMDDALEAFGEVEAKFPDYVATYLMAGQVAIALERIDEARAVLERGTAVAQRAGDAHALSELKGALRSLDL